MAKKPEPELIPAETEAWTVYTNGQHHQLHYRGRIQHRASYEHGRKRLADMADLFNRNKAVPVRQCACAADAINPAEYIARHASKNGSIPTE